MDFITVLHLINRIAHEVEFVTRVILDAIEKAR